MLVLDFLLKLRVCRFGLDFENLHCRCSTRLWNRSYVVIFQLSQMELNVEVIYIYTVTGFAIFDISHPENSFY